MRNYSEYYVIIRLGFIVVDTGTVSLQLSDGEKRQWLKERLIWYLVELATAGKHRHLKFKFTRYPECRITFSRLLAVASRTSYRPRRAYPGIR